MRIEEYLNNSAKMNKALQKIDSQGFDSSFIARIKNAKTNYEMERDPAKKGLLFQKLRGLCVLAKLKKTTVKLIDDHISISDNDIENFNIVPHIKKLREERAYRLNYLAKAIMSENSKDKIKSLFYTAVEEVNSEINYVCHLYHHSGAEFYGDDVFYPFGPEFFLEFTPARSSEKKKVSLDKVGGSQKGKGSSKQKTSLNSSNESIGSIIGSKILPAALFISAVYIVFINQG